MEDGFELDEMRGRGACARPYVGACTRSAFDRRGKQALFSDDVMHVPLQGALPALGHKPGIKQQSDTKEIEDIDQYDPNQTKDKSFLLCSCEGNDK